MNIISYPVPKTRGSIITWERFEVSLLIIKYLSMKVKMSSMCWQKNPAPKNSWNLSEGGGDWPRTLWIICYRKTWRIVFVVHGSILKTTSDHIILNKAVTLMRELIFAKTKSLLNNKTDEIHENRFSRKSILFRYTVSDWARIQFFLGHGSIWDTIKKEKIGTFVSNNKIAIAINKSLPSKKREKWLISSWLHPEQGLILIYSFVLANMNSLSLLLLCSALIVACILLKISLL